MLHVPDHAHPPYEDITSQLCNVLKNAAHNTSNQVTGGLLYLWVNGLPLIITSYGSTLAYEIMEDLHKRLKALLSTDNYVLHIDKDHFAIILPQCAEADMEAKAFEVFHFIVNYQYSLAPVPIQLGATLGGSHFMLHTTHIGHVEDIVNNAYVALNDAKESYRHYVLFSDMKQHAINSIEQISHAHYLQQVLHSNPS
jgi:GGDEF domain-containing protein